MNDDCLGVLFSYLPFKELMELSYMSDYFREIFSNYLSKKVLYNINEGPYTADQLFKLFGERIHRLKMVDRSESETNKLETYLRLIIANYYSTDMLTELHFDLGIRLARCNQTVIEESMAYFTKINKLTIKTPSVFYDYRHFLVRLSTTARNLRILEFKGVCWRGSWSTLTAWTNLIELRIICNGNGLDLFEFDDIETFVRANPSLEVFETSGRRILTSLLNLLSDRCPNMRIYGDRHIRFGIQTHHLFTADRYINVRHFKNIRELSLTSVLWDFSDIKCALVNASKTLESLNIFVEKTAVNPVHQRDPIKYNLPNLKIIRIINGSNGVLDALFEIVHECNVRILHIATTEYASITHDDLAKALDIAPQIKILDIASASMQISSYQRKEELEAVKLIRCLRFKRKNMSSTNIENVEPPLHIIINKNQWREMNKINDWKLFVTAEVR